MTNLEGVKIGDKLARRFRGAGGNSVALVEVTRVNSRHVTVSTGEKFRIDSGVAAQRERFGYSWVELERITPEVMQEIDSLKVNKQLRALLESSAIWHLSVDARCRIVAAIKSELDARAKKSRDFKDCSQGDAK